MEEEIEKMADIYIDVKFEGFERDCWKEEIRHERAIFIHGLKAGIEYQKAYQQARETKDN